MAPSAARAPAPHRFTRADYSRMREIGLLGHERVELLDGTVVSLGAETALHVAGVDRLHRALGAAVGGTARVRAHLPIVLDDWAEPQPDLAVCRFDTQADTQDNPRADQILLVAEVAGSSLAYDRGRKAAAYARSGIPEYWIVDLEGRTVEIRRDPDAATARYQIMTVAREGDRLLTPVTNAVMVSDVLPPR